MQIHCSGALSVDKSGLHIIVVAFIHRFGFSLNRHVHFNVRAIDGVLEEPYCPMNFPEAGILDRRLPLLNRSTSAFQAVIDIVRSNPEPQRSE